MIPVTISRDKHESTQPSIIRTTFPVHLVTGSETLFCRIIGYSCPYAFRKVLLCLQVSVYLISTHQSGSTY